MVLQVVEALVFMHRRRLIHRDIKPSSMLVRRDGLVVVTNLGNIRHLAKRPMGGAPLLANPARASARGATSAAAIPYYSSSHSKSSTSHCSLAYTAPRVMSSIT